MENAVPTTIGSEGAGTIPTTAELLIQAEGSALLDYFLRRTAVADDAADLLQETLLVIWRRKHTIPADATEARMWAFGVAHRVLSGYRRSKARAVGLGERLRLALATQWTAPAPDNGGEVRAAIAGLEPIDREIIRLAYWEGFALEQIATILAMNANTVRSRHARAKARLREALSQ